MSQTTNLAMASEHESALKSLVELFPNAVPLRIPVLASMRRGRGQSLKENSVIEFGTSAMVFLESQLPLELGDRLRLENSDGSLTAEAIVVAMRVNARRRAVAVRFTSEIRNWIIQR